MFIEEYLQELRRDRFSPGAIVLYARRASASVREHIDANPGGVRSLWLVALATFAAAFAVAVAMALLVERRLALDFFLCTALAILPVFGLTTLYIGLLRDREGYTLSSVNLPTALTLLRVTLAPAIVLFLAKHRFGFAVGLFLIAALSDVADGALARRWGQVTRLGVVLDPIVDILFNLAVFTGLVAAHLIPAWVGAVAVLRYGMLLVGGAIICLAVGPVRIQPTLFGKLTGLVVSSLVALLLLLHLEGGPLADRLVPLTELALGVLAWSTVIHVVALGWYNLRLLSGRARAQGRVVGDVRWGAP